MVAAWFSESRTSAVEPFRATSTQSANTSPPTSRQPTSRSTRRTARVGKVQQGERAVVPLVQADRVEDDLDGDVGELGNLVDVQQLLAVRMAERELGDDRVVLERLGAVEALLPVYPNRDLFLDPLLRPRRPHIVEHGPHVPLGLERSRDVSRLERPDHD